MLCYWNSKLDALVTSSYLGFGETSQFILSYRTARSTRKNTSWPTTGRRRRWMSSSSGKCKSYACLKSEGVWSKFSAKMTKYLSTAAPLFYQVDFREYFIENHNFDSSQEKEKHRVRCKYLSQYLNLKAFWCIGANNVPRGPTPGFPNVIRPCISFSTT